MTEPPAATAPINNDTGDLLSVSPDARVDEVVEAVRGLDRVGGTRGMGRSWPSGWTGCGARSQDQGGVRGVVPRIR